MHRRDVLKILGLLSSRLAVKPSSPPGAQLLVPMDEAQTNHLKAYGITFHAIERSGHCEWLLNYRGGSFLIGDDSTARRAAALAGVTLLPVDDGEVARIKGEIAGQNMDAVPLERTPRIGIYTPPNSPPWDDAVTMALQYADIPFTQALGSRGCSAPACTSWTGCTSSTRTSPASTRSSISTTRASPGSTRMVQRNQAAARQLNFRTVADLKKAVANRIRDYVENGGFLFAMCTATETLELALAARNVDIAAAYADGTPMDPDASSKMDWSRSMACTGAHLEASPSTPSYSDIDGHQVKQPGAPQPLGAFELFNFSAKIDPVPSMLVQCHRNVIPDFYGLTTSFTRVTLKPADIILAEEPGAPWVKYIHGDLGRGTWTYFGGHDPEDPQHQIGDTPTDLSLHPTSPGYRLI